MKDINMLRVAVASKHGIAIDEHFGHAKKFYIYEITKNATHHIGIREVPHYCLGGHSDKSAMADILATIDDCHAVFVAKIGDGPSAKLSDRGIQAVSDYTWEEITPSLVDFYQKNELGNVG